MSRVDEEYSLEFDKEQSIQENSEVEKINENPEDVTPHSTGIVLKNSVLLPNTDFDRPISPLQAFSPQEESPKVSPHNSSNPKLLFPLDPPDYHPSNSYKIKEDSMVWLPNYVKRNVKNNYYTIKKIHSSSFSNDYIPVFPYSLISNSTNLKDPDELQTKLDENSNNGSNLLNKSVLETESSYLLLHQQSQVTVPENYNQLFLKSYGELKLQIQPTNGSNASLHSSPSLSPSVSPSKQNDVSSRKSIYSYGNNSLQRSISSPSNSPHSKCSPKRKIPSKKMTQNTEEKWYNVVSYPRYHDAIEALKYFTKFLNIKLLPPGYDIDKNEIQKFKSPFSQITQTTNDNSMSKSSDHFKIINKKLSDYNYRSNRTFNSKIDQNLSYSYMQEIEQSKEIHSIKKNISMLPQSHADLIRMRRPIIGNDSSSKNHSSPIILSRIVCDRSCQQYTVQFNSEVAQKKILKKIITNNNIRNSDNSLTLHIPKNEIYNLVLKNSSLNSSTLFSFLKEKDFNDESSETSHLDENYENLNKNIAFEARKPRPIYQTSISPSTFATSPNSKNITSNFSVEFLNPSIRPQSAVIPSIRSSKQLQNQRPQSSYSTIRNL